MKQTFLQFLAEARKNTNLNPKTSINTEIDEYSHKDPNNSFINFTSVDKLGINPNADYNSTPMGIYSYPVTYVQDVTHGGRSMTDLPYAGDAEYANLFKGVGNIINLSDISLSEAKEYYDKLVSIWVKHSGKDQQTAKQDVDTIVDGAPKYANVPDVIGGQFWYVTKEVAKLLSNVRGGGDELSLSIWNKVFRLIGIDGAIDNGAGIIHMNEPTQAVFFHTGAITDVRRVYNKWSITDVEAKKRKGNKRKQQTITLSPYIKGSAREELVQMFVDGDFRADDLNVVKDPAIRMTLIKKDERFFDALDYPTTEEQIVGIRRQPDSIVRLSKAGALSDNAVLALLTSGDNMLASKVARWIADALSDNGKFIASTNTLMALVDYSIGTLGVLAQKQKLPVDVVKSAINKMGEQSIPTWLRKLGIRYGLIKRNVAI